MNGRIYDPVIGRVLSPDKVVQAPGYTQSYNRYSYCMNNPLRYTDPSGWVVLVNPGFSADTWDLISDSWDRAGGFEGTGSYTYSFEGGDFTGGYTISQGDGAPPGYAWQRTSKRLTHPIGDYKWSDGNGIIYKKEVFYWKLIPDAVGYEFKPQLSLGNYIDGLNISTSRTPVPEWVSWGNTAVNMAGFGAIRTGGSVGMLKSNGAFRYYANAWTGSQYIKTYNLAKLGTGIGIGTSLVGFGIGYYNFSVSDRSWGDYGQLGISFLSAGLTFGVATTPFGIAIGVIDLLHGFDGFYGDLDSQQQFYNITGGIIFPLNGIPYYIQLRKP